VNGRYLVASCEFSSDLVKVDVAARKLVGTLKLPGKPGLQPMPQDVRIAPDGSVFFVADMMSNGVFIIDGELRDVGSFPQAKAHTACTSAAIRVACTVEPRRNGSPSMMKTPLLIMSATKKTLPSGAIRTSCGIG